MERKELNFKEIEGKKFVNCTPHPVVYKGSNGEVVFEPSGIIARVGEVEVTSFKVAGNIEVKQKKFVDPVDIPEPQDNVFYIVSSIVAMSCPHRKDFIVPDEFIRDETGRIVGCKKFSQFVK